VRIRDTLEDFSMNPKVNKSMNVFQNHLHELRNQCQTQPQF